MLKSADTGKLILVKNPSAWKPSRMIFRMTFLFQLAILTVMFTGSSRTEEPTRKGSLDYFMTEETLWTLDPAALEKRLLPEGWVRDPKSQGISFGDAREMMMRESHILKDARVWGVKLELIGTLNLVYLDFLPPPNLAPFFTKSDFRALSKKIEDGVGAWLKVKPLPYTPDWLPQEKTYKPTCLRWLSKDFQCILNTLTQEVGSTFKVIRFELKIGRAENTQEELPAKPPVAKIDRAARTIVLEGIPGISNWPAKHPEWSILEQALLAIGKRADRNAIREHYSYGSPWVTIFVGGVDRLVLAAGAKITPIIPYVYSATEQPKIEQSCLAAAKKLNKTAPQTLVNLLDVSPDVLRAARATPNVVAQFTTSLKTSLAANRPLFWVGFLGVFPETNAPPGTVPVGTRLMIGLDELQGEVIFADPSGKAGTRMKIADAIASSYFVHSLISK